MILDTDILNQLPGVPAERLQPALHQALHASGKVIIVLDDDPTGTQTVHAVPVLTSWDIESISSELSGGFHMFFILTNSRSLDKQAAMELNELIGRNIITALQSTNKSAIIISRSDSTLRGHYPYETTALRKGMQLENVPTVIMPAFLEGGRYTINDVHYVREAELLIPAAETVFAEDKAFGFTQSNLKYWIQEKNNHAISAEEVVSFSINELRSSNIEQLVEKIKSLPSNATVIVNGVDYYDLENFSLAYYEAGVEMLFRTAASFVKAVSGCIDKDLLQKDELIDDQTNGGLIVVGSYVPKTTTQLNQLLQHHALAAIEVSVEALLDGKLQPEQLSNEIDAYLLQQQNVLFYTSRELNYGENEKKSLLIGSQVSDFLTAVVAGLQVQPRFLVAKGGITSSDIATKALQIKRAVVMGQALPGVPVWQAGIESKFPGMSYIIFPGNVGADDALAILYEKLT